MHPWHVAKTEGVGADVDHEADKDEEGSGSLRERNGGVGCCGTRGVCGIQVRGQVDEEEAAGAEQKTEGHYWDSVEEDSAAPDAVD